jgi:hypothetical protein
MPEASGSRQEYVFEGFPFANPKAGTTFYFALQVRDEAGNFSAISNLASLSYEGEVELEAEPAGQGAETDEPGQGKNHIEAAAGTESVQAVPEELRRACRDLGCTAFSILDGFFQSSPDIQM